MTQKEYKPSFSKLANKKLLIGMPAYGGNVQIKTAIGLLQTAILCSKYNVLIDVFYIEKESLISRGRNTVANYFVLNYQPKDYLLFIDTDIGFNPYHVLMLLEEDKDVIGGLYPVKDFPIRWVVSALTEDVNVGSVKEVKEIGTGFMMIKYETFKALDDISDEYVCDVGSIGEIHKDYFQVGVIDRRYLSEDYYFCHKVRKKGLNIFVQGDVLLDHIGHCNYNLEKHLELAKEYTKQYQPTGENK